MRNQTTVRIPYNWRPRQYQLPAWLYLERGGRHAELVWHRRAGKDDVGLHYAAHSIVRQPATYWHMLPEAAQARKAIWEAVNPHTRKRRIDEVFPHAIRASTRENEMLIKFFNGATWQVVGSDNYDSLVGSPPYGVVFSEWALAKPEARDFIRPAIIENGGWQIYNTTPRGPNHALKSLRSAQNDPDAFAQVLPATDTDVFTPEQLEKERLHLIATRGEEIGQAIYEQEYLCSFTVIIAGLAVFDRKRLSAARAECYSPLYRAEIINGKIVERSNGRLSVWYPPNNGGRFVMGADVAEGVLRGDYSSADVLDARGNQVAHWHGHIDPDKYGEVLCALGKWYGNALIGVERNNHGLTTLVKMRDLGYPNIYAQQDYEHRADDKETKKLGWQTTAKSKPMLIDALAAELRDGALGVAHTETIAEMETYIITEKNTYEAKPGFFDDRVISRAIAGMMLPLLPVTLPRRTPAQKVVYGDTGTGY